MLQAKAHLVVKNNDIDQQTLAKIQGTVTILTDVSQLISGRIEVINSLIFH